MEKESSGLIIGISIGVVIGVLLAIVAFFCFRRYHRRRPQIGNSSSRRAATVPIRANGVDTCTVLSDSSMGTESPKSIQNGMPLWLGSVRKSNVVSASGILEYSYKDLQRATYNFTTLIGQGAYGPVYKAQMSTGETVAVKVLATDSKQGEKEFQTEVMLLGRLHHRNLVNLVGYCAEKGQHMLIYVYMSRGSLASHLYDEKLELLRWELRVQIALDVARGLEYLHDGAVPPVVHRDIKSSNILLDQSMRARVADFGLSREEMVSKHVSNIRGTFGYLDPEYISTRSFTKKSDVYSFGVLLFELIAGKNPLQGLIEYIELVTSTEGPCLITAKLKRWERKECKTNSLPVLHKMHVKLGDTVKVISGHDKGKIGEITEIIKHNSKVVVKEVNLKTKHVKSRSEDEPGQIVKIEAPIHSSNVMLYSKEQKVASRVGHKTLDNGKRVRYLIKTGEIIDSAENWKKAVKEKEKTTEAVAAAS